MSSAARGNLLGYRATRAKNRDTFLLNFRDDLRVFDRLDREFNHAPYSGQELAVSKPLARAITEALASWSD